MIEIQSESLTPEIMRLNLNLAQASWHDHCVACGQKNSHGLGLHFKVTAEGQVEASFSCKKCFEGFPQSLHGGYVAVLLDSAMTNCLFAHGLVGMTGELKVRFRHVVNTSSAARVRAWLERSSHRLHFLAASLEQDGSIKATASGKFLETPMGLQSRSERDMHGKNRTL
jgi:acyl-coenzyme A thioesterase PaaI-like protein